MALSALSHYKGVKGPHQEQAGRIYHALRQNIISTIFSEYSRTGYLWEQYDPASGRGKGCHPFTGWTSLVVLIMAEQFE